MKIKPFGERAIVKYKKVEYEKGSLILPYEETPQFATVVEAEYNPIFDIEVGDLVVLSKYAGIPVKVEDEVFLVVEMKDIIAYVE